MRAILYLPIAWGLTCQLAVAQVSWMAGGGFRSFPRSGHLPNVVGLASVPDRDWHLGVSTSWRRKINRQSGLLFSLRLRSPFFELDAALPYYPLKRHMPAYRVESFTLNPFVGVSGTLDRSERIGWVVRVGPVFEFHSGNFLSTTTARTIPGQSSFILYQLYVRRHPLGIPYGRVQAEWSYLFLKRRSINWRLKPFLQLDFGDRSQIRYVALPNDPIRRSESRGNGNYRFRCTAVPRSLGRECRPEWVLAPDRMKPLLGSCIHLGVAC
ncbi:MAG: hypothetical protein ACKO6Q_06290 [Bacteroidota bacterium]